MFYTHNRKMSIKGFIFKYDKGKVKGMKKLSKVLSFALAMVVAVTTFTTTAFAASRGDAYRRELTTEEVQSIYSIFDAKYYANAYPDVMHFYGYDYYTPECDATLFTHFAACGIWEERQPCAEFNIDVYATRNVDLRSQFGDDIIAYYVYYASHLKEQSWRIVPTWSDAYYHGVTVYSVYDLVAGDAAAVKPGAIPVQTPTNAPMLGIVNGQKKE